jgi:hypothetical protein
MDLAEDEAGPSGSRPSALPSGPDPQTPKTSILPRSQAPAAPRPRRILQDLPRGLEMDPDSSDSDEGVRP